MVVEGGHEDPELVVAHDPAVVLSVSRNEAAARGSTISPVPVGPTRASCPYRPPLRPQHMMRADLDPIQVDDEVPALQATLHDILQHPLRGRDRLTAHFRFAHSTLAPICGIRRRYLHALTPAMRTSHIRSASCPGLRITR